ncbi:glycine-rich protein [Natrinema salifodinae]|nr:fibronectin type III domain-containing protein [Natrinema salifodinae]
MTIEAYGAGGGHSRGGAGGYAVGDRDDLIGETITINVGGAGEQNAGGINGGARGGRCSDDPSQNGYGGGGASDVRYGGSTLDDRIIVAGGGGGAPYTDSYQGGDGGGLQGEDGEEHYDIGYGGGGTQTSGGSGAGGYGQESGVDGSFGAGGRAGDSDQIYDGAGGGGGGWYGGGGGAASLNDSAVGGGGGSSYISDVTDASTTIGGGASPDTDGQVVITITVDPPTNVSAQQAGDSSVDLSWDAEINADEYRIYRATSTGSSLSDYSQVGSTTSASYTDTGLINGRSYYYRVTTVGGSSESDPSDEASATTALPTPTVDVVETAFREVTVDYADSDDNPDGNLTLERQVNSMTTIETSSPGDHQYIDTDILDGVTHEYTVRRDTGDATRSVSESVLTELPAVESLSVESVDGRYVTLSWTDPSNNADGYRLLLQRPADSSYSQDGSDFDPVVEGETKTVTTTELLDGQEYSATVETYTAETSTREDQ